MSVVTGTVLCCSLSDGLLIGDINEWLFKHEFGRLSEVQERFGGNKHPQMVVMGAGYNYFEHVQSEFIAFVLSRSWKYPENLILILQPEDGATRVVRGI